MVVSAVESRSDAELAAAAAGGDQAAFAALYERYFDRVYDFVVRLVRDRDDAADVVQDAFLKAMNGIGSLQEGASFKSWLFTIARNTALHRIERASRTRPLVMVDGDGEETSFDVVDPDRFADPQAASEAGAMASLVWEAAAGLDPKQLSLLDLVVRQDLGSAEIADVLGVSKNNAYVMVNRLKSAVEEAIGAFVMARTGRRECADLDALLSRVESDAMTPELRRMVSRHVKDCETCRERKRRLLPPLVVFGAFAPVAPPLGLQAAIFERLEQASGPATGARGSGNGASGSPPASAAGGGSRWPWLRRGGFAALGGMVAAVILLLLLVPVSPFALTGGDGTTEAASGGGTGGDVGAGDAGDAGEPSPSETAAASATADTSATAAAVEATSAALQDEEATAAAASSTASAAESTPTPVPTSANQGSGGGGVAPPEGTPVATATPTPPPASTPGPSGPAGPTASPEPSVAAPDATPVDTPTAAATPTPTPTATPTSSPTPTPTPCVVELAAGAGSITIGSSGKAQFRVSNEGCGTAEAETSSSAVWLSVSPAKLTLKGGDDPAFVTVSLAKSGLPGEGDYLEKVSVSAGSDVVTVQVNVTIAGDPPSITFAQIQCSSAPLSTVVVYAADDHGIVSVVAATTGKSPVTLSRVSGTDTNGQWAGSVPTPTSNQTVVVTVTDAAGQTATQTLSCGGGPRLTS